MYALRCGGFAELSRAGAKIEAWPFVVVGCEWRNRHVVAGASGHAGERGCGRARACTGRSLRSLIARAAGPGWRRRHRAATERRRVADGRGWAGDVNDDVEGAQAHGLVLLLLLLLARRGTGRFGSCGA